MRLVPVPERRRGGARGTGDRPRVERVERQGKNGMSLMRQEHKYLRRQFKAR